MADCRATGTLLCNSDSIAGVQCAGEIVAGIYIIIIANDSMTIF